MARCHPEDAPCTSKIVRRIIFGTSAGLRPGKALLLVDDYDSKALFYQFQAESSEQVNWDELGTSPDAWRVRIGKTGIARECCAGCPLTPCAAESDAAFEEPYDRHFDRLRRACGDH